MAGDPDELDTRSDIYALGVVGYELLTGHLPYDLARKPIPEAVRIIGQEDARPLSAVSRTFRGDVDTIIGKALEKDRACRYASAAELAADIRRYLRHEPITAHPPSTFYQLRKVVQRHRLPFALATIVFAVTLAFAVTTAYQAARIGDERDQARTEAAKAEAVSDFLQRMFASPNPEQEGHEVRVVDVLDRAGAQIDRDFAEQPEVRVNLHGTLGETYFALGLYDKADGSYTAALQAAREALGENHELTLRAMSSLGGVHQVYGDCLRRAARYQDSETHLLAAHPILEAALGEQHARTIAAVQALVDLYDDWNRPDRATAWRKRLPSGPSPHAAVAEK